MTTREKVNQLIYDTIQEREDLFIIKQSISESLDINLTIDGDELINISDCIEISRKIERALDEDELEFSIKVQSPGASEPLLFPRQYNKHVGRRLNVKVNGTQIEGILISANDEGIVLSWKTREKKTVGKGKITVKHEKSISYKEIESANIKITFNKN